MDQAKVQIRNPLLVLIWSFGLFILMNVVRYIGALLAAAVGDTSFDAIMSGEIETAYTLLAKGLTAALLGVPLTFLIVRFLWRRSWDWMRMRFSLRMLLSGGAFGLLLPILAVAITSLLGQVEMRFNPAGLSTSELWAVAIGTLSSLLLTAVTEEVVFRSMAIREWGAKWGWPTGILLGGVYFGVLHILPLFSRATVLSLVWVVLASLAVTVLFAAMYIRSRSLWLPIGFHLGWNYCLSSILGTTMSGRESKLGLMSTELSGSSAVTGGEFGLEASVVCVVLYLVTAYLFFTYSRQGTTRLLNPTEDVRPDTQR